MPKTKIVLTEVETADLLNACRLARENMNNETDKKRLWKLFEKLGFAFVDETEAKELRLSESAKR